jgi:soluble lytic murein transglycosylase-like protein
MPKNHNTSNASIQVTNNIKIVIILLMSLIPALLGVISIQHVQLADMRQARADVDSDMLVFVIERHILASNRQLPLSVSRRIAVAGIECAKAYNLDPLLLFATMQQESNFNPRAIGSIGERGLMQISRTTAGDIGLPWKASFDVLANTCAGASYLSQHVQARGVHDGLLRYNGGAAPDYPLLVLARYQTLNGAE